MDLNDSDMGPNKIVTWDMVISYIRQGTRLILSVIEMHLFTFLKNRHVTSGTCLQGPH